jgi:hypothetical protein
MIARSSHASTTCEMIRRSTPGLIIEAPGRYEWAGMRCEVGGMDGWRLRYRERRNGVGGVPCSSAMKPGPPNMT